MKKFTNKVNEKVKPYNGNNKLRSDIYELIEKYIIAKIDGEETDQINIIGKERLTEEIVLYIEKEINKIKIYFLEKLKDNPKFFEIFSEMRDEYKKIFKSIKDVKDKKDIEAINDDIEKFNEKWNNVFNDDEFVIMINKLKENLNNKNIKLKNNNSQNEKI